MLDKFKKIINDQGLAKNNKWIVRVYPPKGLSATGTVLSNIINRNGSKVDIDLPVLNNLDETVNAVNNLVVPVGDLGISSNVNLPTLGFVLGNMGETIDSLTFMAETCAIPARDISNVEFREYGEKRSLGVSHTHDGFEISYLCSENLRERLFFEQWQNLIFNPNTKEHGYYEEYVSKVEIIKYDSGWKDRTAIYTFTEAYPTNIGALELQSGEGDLLRQSITFNFRNYEREA